MHYTIWFTNVICQIGALACLILINKKKNDYSKSKKNLFFILITLQLISIALWFYLRFVN